jgi:hypothetical protein
MKPTGGRKRKSKSWPDLTRRSSGKSERSRPNRDPNADGLISCCSHTCRKYLWYSDFDIRFEDDAEDRKRKLRGRKRHLCECPSHDRSARDMYDPIRDVDWQEAELNTETTRARHHYFPRYAAPIWGAKIVRKARQQGGRINKAQIVSLVWLPQRP